MDTPRAIAAQFVIGIGLLASATPTIAFVVPSIKMLCAHESSQSIDVCQWGGGQF